MINVLIEAIRENKVEEIKKLVANIKNLNQGDDLGRTPLWYAISRGLDIVEILLKQGADPNLSLDADEETPLGFAVIVGAVEIIRLMHEYKADLNQRLLNGMRPLEYANFFHDFAMAGVLLECGAR